MRSIRNVKMHGHRLCVAICQVSSIHVLYALKTAWRKVHDAPNHTTNAILCDVQLSCVKNMLVLVSSKSYNQYYFLLFFFIFYYFLYFTTVFLHCVNKLYSVYIRQIWIVDQQLQYLSSRIQEADISWYQSCT